jgi:hypothetical protein
MGIGTTAPQPWTHIGRVWTSGEPLLAMDASLAGAWDSDRFDELIDLGAEAALIAVGDGTAAIIHGDGTVNDEGWIEIFGSGQDQLAFVHASGRPYDGVLHAALAYLPIRTPAAARSCCSAANWWCSAPRPTPPAYRPASAATPAAETLAGLAVPLHPRAYQLRVRWRTDLPGDAAFARWLLLP